jgi:hypothetical protein
MMVLRVEEALLWPTVTCGGPTAAKAQGGSILWLSGGGGTADRGGDGEVVEAIGAVAPRQESGVEVTLR